MSTGSTTNPMDHIGFITSPPNPKNAVAMYLHVHLSKWWISTAYSSSKHINMKKTWSSYSNKYSQLLTNPIPLKLNTRNIVPKMFSNPLHRPWFLNGGRIASLIPSQSLLVKSLVMAIYYYTIYTSTMIY